MITQTCQKTKYVLIVWETASLAQVSQLSCKADKNIIVSDSKRETLGEGREGNIKASTIWELNSLVDCMLTRSHLFWSLALSLAWNKIDQHQITNQTMNKSAIQEVLWTRFSATQQIVFSNIVFYRLWLSEVKDRIR